MRAGAGEALGDAAPCVYWLDRPDRPSPTEPLIGPAEADLVIVGGGFTGLWAAIQAAERDPDRSIVLLEARFVGFGASGRNGGFVEASLTHGLENGVARFPTEIDVLQRLAADNFAGIASTIERHGIDASWHAVGHVGVATEPHQVRDLRASVDLLRRYGEEADFLERDEVRAELDSPTYLGGVWIRTGGATVDPARLAWGLRDAARRLGVRIHENTPVVELVPDGAGLAVVAPGARVRARRVLLGTGAYPPLVGEVRRYVATIHDYVLVTEPLSADRLRAIGWPHRQGFSGEGSRFTYYRLTDDDRILWGGYEAVYPFRGGRHGPRDQDQRVAELLATRFFETFPQLAGIRFTHHWGGPIDMDSRFSVMFGSAFEGRAVYALGYTGLGLAATRFGADAALDLLDGRSTERTALDLVRHKPKPIPPEPLRWPIIRLTQRALARAEARGGRTSPWLKLLDRMGAGFGT